MSLFSLPQSARKQHFCSDGFKTVASAHTLSELHKPVERFCWTIADTMVKVSHDLGMPVVHRGEQWLKGGNQIIWQIMLPGLVQRLRLVAGGSTPNLEKAFFTGVSSFEYWKVFSPCLKNQALVFIQITQTTKQDKPVVHQSAPFSVRETGTQLLTHSVQAGISKLDDMKMIDNHSGMWQKVIASLFVGLPHIHTDAGDSIAKRCWQSLQIVLDRSFIPVAQKVKNRVLFDIGQHTSGLGEQVDLINAQITDGGIDHVLCQVSSCLMEERANRPFIQTNIISNAGEGSMQCLLGNEDGQPLCDEVMFVHLRGWLKESAIAGAAAISASCNDEANRLAAHRQICEWLMFDLVAIEQSALAMDTTRWRSGQLRLKGNTLLVLINCQKTIVCQPQEVQGQLSQKVLPHEFS